MYKLDDLNWHKKRSEESKKGFFEHGRLSKSLEHTRQSVNVKGEKSIVVMERHDSR